MLLSLGASNSRVFQPLQANPDLVDSDPAVAEEFEAAPWLLPPRTLALPYAGLHDLDYLLELRSQPAGQWDGSVTFLLFSKAYAVMVQNSSECQRCMCAAECNGFGRCSATVCVGLQTSKWSISGTGPRSRAPPNLGMQPSPAARSALPPAAPTLSRPVQSTRW